MLEFYWAYADVNAMMDFCEDMLRAVIFKVVGHTHVPYGSQSIDFGQPFRRVGMKESLEGLVDQEKITNENVVTLFEEHVEQDRKSTRLNSSHSQISYAVFCLKKKIK